MNAEQELLERLERAFDHLRIKDQKHPDPTATSANDSCYLQNPSSEANVELRKCYPNAFKANEAAKQRNAHVFNQSKQEPLGSAQQGAEPPLIASRLECLRQQKYYAKLEILEHHAREVDRLSKDGEESSEPVDSLKQRDYSSDATSIDGLIENGRAKIRELEREVVTQRHHAAREKARLNSLRQTSNQISGEITDNDRIRALEAVRGHLTLWLEDGLASCNTDDLVDEANQIFSDNDTETTPQEVQEAYDRYCLSRASLLGSMNNKAVLVEQPSKLHQEVNSNVHRYTLPNMEDKTCEIEHRMLVVEKEHSMRHLQEYLDESLVQEATQAVALLQRLADESQLLSSYPILARSAKFQKTVQAMGVSEPDHKRDSVIEQAKAWDFAANASDETTKASVAGHLKQGNHAISAAERSLKEMQFLQEAATNITPAKT